MHSLMFTNFFMTLAVTSSFSFAMVQISVNVMTDYLLLRFYISTWIQDFALNNPAMLAHNHQVSIYQSGKAKLSSPASLICLTLWAQNSDHKGVTALEANYAATNAELTEKKEELEAALEKEEMFVLTFSHELKNLLEWSLG